MTHSLWDMLCQAFLYNFDPHGISVYYIFIHSYCGHIALPEGVDHKLQHDVLDLSVQGRLPVPALGSQRIHISSSSKVTQIQVIMKLETLCPAHTDPRYATSWNDMNALHTLKNGPCSVVKPVVIPEKERLVSSPRFYCLNRIKWLH